MKDLGPDELRGSAEVTEDPAIKVQAFCGGRKTQLSSRLSVVCEYKKLQKKPKKSALRDSSIYSM